VGNAFLPTFKSFNINSAWAQKACPPYLAQDEEVINIKQWIDGLPELTSGQIAAQIKDQREFFDSMSSKTR